MNQLNPGFRPSVSFAIVGVIILAALTIITLSIIAGGWVVNWMIPSIKFEFGCLIFGQGLLLTAIPLGILGNGALRHMRDERLAEENADYNDEEDEDDDEEAEWLAERITDLMLARMNQGPPKERRYTAKAQRK